MRNHSLKQLWALFIVKCQKFSVKHKCAFSNFPDTLQRASFLNVPTITVAVKLENQAHCKVSRTDRKFILILTLFSNLIGTVDERPHYWGLPVHKCNQAFPIHQIAASPTNLFFSLYEHRIRVHSPSLVHFHVLQYEQCHGQWTCQGPQYLPQGAWQSMRTTDWTQRTVQAIFRIDCGGHGSSRRALYCICG